MTTEQENIISAMERLQKAHLDLLILWEKGQETGRADADGEALNYKYPFEDNFEEYPAKINVWTNEVKKQFEQKNARPGLEFIFRGQKITNMFMDETGRFEVDPLQYYFITRDKVETLLKN